MYREYRDTDGHAGGITEWDGCTYLSHIAASMRGIVRVGRRYLIALNCKEAEIFILKMFTGKTRLVFFAQQQRPALKGLITIRTIDERISGKNHGHQIYWRYSGTL
ncbi:hypothetical protein ALC53_13951 [Atta colombica]|uniref:Uncharacterized protein n=1 Tax=Atta colombica TaxID=520822 RepID=A0A195AUM8_9HYME|nr:hypothetical protein ALC53_13951 [Atta colombica]